MASGEGFQNLDELENCKQVETVDGFVFSNSSESTFV
jgi:hypothetical protein